MLIIIWLDDDYDYNMAMLRYKNKLCKYIIFVKLLLFPRALWLLIDDKIIYKKISREFLSRYNILITYYVLCCSRFVDSCFVLGLKLWQISYYTRYDLSFINICLKKKDTNENIISWSKIKIVEENFNFN